VKLIPDEMKPEIVRACGYMIFLIAGAILFAWGRGGGRR